MSAAMEPDEPSAPVPSASSGTLRAFRHRDFTLLWVGALVSNTGSWLQNLAVPYVVYALTGSALWVGLATTAQFLPALVGGPVGGHLADTRERRRLLLVQLAIMAIFAAGLWWIWASGSRSVPLILLTASAIGLMWGMQMPAWQAFVNDLVPREDLVSAVSLNSLQYNAARSVGPAIAGVVIATRGPAAAFALNSLSFVVVLIALGLVRAHSAVHKGGAGFLEGYRLALRYIPTQPGIAVVIATVVFLGLLATPVFGFTVVFAQSVFHVGPLQLGLMNACLGVGALLAVPVLVRAKNGHGLRSSIRYGVLVMGGGFVAFGAAPAFAAGAVALVALGMGFLLSISAGQTAVQLIVAARLRGRVMALRLMVYVLATTVGALAQGWLADRVGARATMVGCGVLLVIIGALFFTRRGARVLARVDDPQDTSDW